MRCICKNCIHCLEHPDGKVCAKNLVFVDENNTCDSFDNDIVTKPIGLVVLAIVVIGIVILCAKFL